MPVSIAMYILVIATNTTVRFVMLNEGARNEQQRAWIEPCVVKIGSLPRET